LKEEDCSVWAISRYFIYFTATDDFLLLVSSRVLRTQKIRRGKHHICNRSDLILANSSQLGEIFYISKWKNVSDIYFANIATF